MRQIHQCMVRAKRAQDAGREDNAAQAEYGDHDKLHQHDWPENIADEGGSFRLNEKQRDEDRDAEGHHGGG
jgi:hypothetical protein